MMYGNASNGYSYSPDRRNDRVNHYNNSSRFYNAQGSAQGGFYYTGNMYDFSNRQTTSNGWYDGQGNYHRG